MESRYTFRNKVTSEAWQYKIRKQREKEWLDAGKPRFWEDIDLSLKNARVKEVDRKTAEKIILKYEWLGDMAVTNKFYGIFFGVYCAGVICINTHGVHPNNGKMYGIHDSKVSYFARGACTFWSPNGTASKLLSWALKFEKERGALVAHAFADTDAGEYGTVYQATNWICLGKQNFKDFQYTKGTRCLDSRTIRNLAKRANMNVNKYHAQLESLGWEKQEKNQKYRYCYILADEPERSRIYAKILKLVSEYPKRP